MVNHSAKSTDKIHVLILSDGDEYIYWVASFADKADADAAAKIANDGLRPDSGHNFYVSEYPAYPAGSVPSLDQIKAASDDDHHCDEMWTLTLEERLDDIDPPRVVREVQRLALEVFPGLITTELTEAAFDLLHGYRRVAIADWIDDPYHDIYKIPSELRPDGALPIVPAPGQQELPVQ